jgi:hypothetical protein
MATGTIKKQYEHYEKMYRSGLSDGIITLEDLVNMTPPNTILNYFVEKSSYFSDWPDSTRLWYMRVTIAKLNNAVQQTYIQGFNGSNGTGVYAVATVNGQYFWTKVV